MKPSVKAKRPHQITSKDITLIKLHQADKHKNLMSYVIDNQSSTKSLNSQIKLNDSSRPSSTLKVKHTQNENNKTYSSRISSKTKRIKDIDESLKKPNSSNILLLHDNSNKQSNKHVKITLNTTDCYTAFTPHTVSTPLSAKKSLFGVTTFDHD